MAIVLRSAEEPPFASLLHEAADGTFKTDLGIDLTRFLMLVLHREHFELSDDEEVLSTHPHVFLRVSLLAQAIMAGNPPTCPPISSELTYTHLRGLSLVQREHLERVLLYGTEEIPPPQLKDLSGVSPYALEAKSLPVWQREGGEGPASHEEDLPRPVELSEISLSDRRRECVMEWFHACFMEVTVRRFKFVVPMFDTLIARGKYPLRDFLDAIVSDETPDESFRELRENLVRRGVLKCKDPAIPSPVFYNVFLPAVEESDVSLVPCPYLAASP